MLIRVVPSAQKLSIDCNEEKKKRLAITNQAEALDARVKELERALVVVEEMDKRREVVMSKLQDEHNVLKESFALLSKEKNEREIVEKTTMDRALMAETQLTSLWTELDNLKVNPNEELRDRIIEEYI